MAVGELSSEDRGSGRSVDLGAYGFLILMVLVGSTTATAAKFAVRELPVGLLPLVRFGVAGLCLLPLVLRRDAFWPMLRDDPLRLLVAAALCVPINQSFFLNAARMVPTSHVALFYASCPLVVLLLATALGQERLSLRRLTGILISVSGVAVIGLESLWHGTTVGRTTQSGDLLLVGAVVSWGAYLTVNKPLIARHGPLPVLASTFLLGAFLEVPIALAALPASWSSLANASPAAWRGLAYLTLVVTALGLAFQNQALRRLDASQVATANNAAPVLTILWGVWLFQEAITPALALGGVLTLGGIAWTSTPEAAWRRLLQWKPMPAFPMRRD